MLLLLETPSGYALFKKKLTNGENYDFKLYSFYKYNSKIEAYKSIESLKNRKLPKSLKQFLKNSSKKDQPLVVIDRDLKKEIVRKIGPLFKKILTKKKIYREL